MLKASWRLTVGDYTYTELDDGTLSITGYTGEDTSITIPRILNSKTVTTISSNAFKGNTILTSVTLPSTITTVNNGAFENCTSLKEVIFNTGITSYGDNILLGCSSLESITIDVLNQALIGFFDYDEANIPTSFNKIVLLSNSTSSNIQKINTGKFLIVFSYYESIMFKHI